MANYELGLLTKEQKDAIVLACQEILNGEHHEQFPVDMIPVSYTHLDVYKRQGADYE